MRDRSHDESMVELYRKRPELVAEVINSLLEDGEKQETLIILRRLTQAFGGVQAVAESAGLNPTQLYRTLSADGNPSLNSLVAVLMAMKLRLAVLPVKAGAEDSERIPTGDTVHN